MGKVVAMKIFKSLLSGKNTLFIAPLFRAGIIDD